MNNIFIYNLNNLDRKTLIAKYTSLSMNLINSILSNDKCVLHKNVSLSVNKQIEKLDFFKSENMVIFGTNILHKNDSWWYCFNDYVHLEAYEFFSKNGLINISEEIHYNTIPSNTPFINLSSYTNMEFYFLRFSENLNDFELNIFCNGQSNKADLNKITFRKKSIISNVIIGTNNNRFYMDTYYNNKYYPNKNKPKIYKFYVNKTNQLIYHEHK